MRRRRLAAILSLMGLIALPALAHHSFDAEYNSTKTIKIVGFVTKVDWVNPHAFVYLDSTDARGVVHTYRVEMGPPYALARSGWTKDTLKVGDKITIENAAQSKDGSNTAGSMPQTSMTLANGQKMVMR